jgi:hypothetical protein
MPNTHSVYQLFIPFFVHDFMCVAYASGFFHLLSNPEIIFFSFSIIFLVIIMLFPSKRGGEG